jgi:hypothetical protein
LGTDVDGNTDLEVNATTGTVTHRYFDPFGNSRGAQASWSDDHGFLNDPTGILTGLTQIGARVYDAAIGMFTTVDPVLDTDDPQQVNGRVRVRGQRPGHEHGSQRNVAGGSQRRLGRLRRRPQRIRRRFDPATPVGAGE